MRFTKMHGIGNDYVYLDCVRNAPPRDPAALSRSMSDRHFGVGADGLILIGPSERADARMRMFNADGSEAEMCGNGLRCVAKFVHDHAIARKPKLTIETGRGVLTVELEIHDNRATRVRVNMGEPILESAKIPTVLPGDPPVNAPLSVAGQQFNVTCVSMGNPHVICYVGEEYFQTEPRDRVVELGPKIENAPEFPRRVNVHFVKTHSRNEVTMRTWERGSGITLACGTGACAVCVAGVLTGNTDRKLLAHLPGGDLELEWNQTDHCVYMTGPATEVFTGEWPD